MECPGDLCADAHGEFGRRELEERVELKAGASSQGILDGDPSRADIAGAGEIKRQPGNGAGVLSCAEGREHRKITGGEVRAAKGDAALALKNAVGIEQAIGVDEKVGRARCEKDFGEKLLLELVVVEAIEEFQADAESQAMGRLRGSRSEPRGSTR